MKQTNNAIKFLMAQYRAIFKNAYLKGLASAAVLTAALASGQAQAQGPLTDIEALENSSKTDTITVKAENNNNFNINLGNGSGTSWEQPHKLSKNLVIDDATIDENSDSNGNIAQFYNSSTNQAYLKSTGSLEVKKGMLKLSTAGTGSLQADFAGVELNSGGSLKISSAKADSTTKTGNTYLFSTGDININGGKVELLNNIASGNSSSQKSVGNAKLTTNTSGGAININNKAEIIIGAASTTAVTHNISKAVLGWTNDLDVKNDKVVFKGPQIKVDGDSNIILNGYTQGGGYGANIYADSFTLDKSNIKVEGQGALLQARESVLNNAYVEVASGANFLLQPRSYKGVTLGDKQKYVEDSGSDAKYYDGLVTINSGILKLDGAMIFNRGGTLNIGKDVTIVGNDLTTNSSSVNNGTILVGLGTTIVDKITTNEYSVEHTTNPTLNIASSTLDSFLNKPNETILDKDKQPITDKTGLLHLKTGARLNFTDTEAVDVSKFKFVADNKTSGIYVDKISNYGAIGTAPTGEDADKHQIDGNVVIHADKMVVGKSLLVDKTVDTNNTSLRADFTAKEMTLGSEASGADWKGFDSSVDRVGGRSFTAFDKFAFIDGTSDTFTLKDYAMVDREFFKQTTDACNPDDYNTSGSIVGDHIKVNSGSLAVTGGYWTNTDNQTLTLVAGFDDPSGSGINDPYDGSHYALEVKATGAKTTDKTNSNNNLGIDIYDKVKPAYLAWNGNFILQGAKDAGLVNVKGNKAANATLDLTGATKLAWESGVVDVQGDVGGFNAVNIIEDDKLSQQGYGVLKITDDQLGSFFNGKTDTGADYSAQLKLADGGILYVDNAGTNTIRIDHLANFNNTAEQGKITFVSGSNLVGGILYHTGTLELVTGVDVNGNALPEDNDTVRAELDIGTGAIYAKNIDISNKHLGDKAEYDTNQVVVADGTLAVNQSLRTENQRIVFGKDSGTKAHLILGFNVADANNIGSVEGDLVFNAGSTLTVQDSTWIVDTNNTDGDITLNGDASLTVNTSDYAYEDLGFSGASLKADNLRIDSATGTNGTNNVNISNHSSAEFETVQASGAHFKVDGHFKVNGRVIEEITDTTLQDQELAYIAKDTNGVDLTGSTINVSGAGAVFEFGKVATDGLLTNDANTKLTLHSGGITDTTWNVSKFGQVKFDFENFNDKLIDADDIGVLVSSILNKSATGYLNLANANLGITSFTERANGYYNATWEKDVENFKQVVGHATTDQLLNTVIQVADDQSKVRGHYAALEVTDKNNNSYDTITLDGPTSLHHSDANGGNFVSFNGNVGNVNLNSDAGLALFGSGTIGSITGTRNTGGDIIDENGKVVEDGLNSLYISNEIAEGETTTSQVTIAGAVKNINEFGISTGAQVSVNDSATNIGYVGLFDNSSLTVTHDLQSDGLEVEAGSSVKAENTKFIDGLVMGKSNTTDTLTLGDKQYGYGELLIYGGEVVTKNLTLANNSHNTSYGVEVGTGIEDKDFDDPESLYNEQIGYAGTLEVRGKTILNKGWLNVLAEDTQADKGVSFASLNELSGTANATNAFAGTLDGDLLVGLHGVTGVGVKDMATLKSELSRFYDGTNLTTDAQSILYLGQAFTIGEDQSVILTSQKYEDFLGYVRETNTKRTDKQNIKLDVNCANDLLSNHVLYMGEGSLIVVDDAVAKKAEITGLEGVTAQAMLNFAGQDGTVIADGGDMFINGNVRTNVDYQVFGNAKIEYLDGTAYKVALEGEANEDKNINVSTKNNFLNGVVDEQGILSLNIDKHARGIMAGASDPVYDTIVAYARGYYGPEVTKPQAPAEGGEAKAAATAPVEQERIYSLDKAGNKVYQYENHFISETINTGDGSAVETVARLGVFGGMSQTAIAVAGTSSDAMAARMGIGGKNTQLSVADNGQGASLWVAPIYKSYNSDTFAIQSLNYGVDIDMYGLALGGDYSLGNGMKFGAMFNLGSGDTEGNGAATGTTNDFNYYGFGAFFGYSIDQFSVMADASYTIVDNDLEANTAIEKVSSSADASTYSIGVTAQYTIDMAGFEIAPHIGARYSSIDLDDYIIKGASGDIALYEAEKINVFSIPVGVSFAKEIVSESWTVKPSLDLTVTVNAGDDTADGNVYWAGAENLRTTGLKSEILDSVTYGATAGFSAKSGNFSLGLGVSYTGSSNTDELGVNANARFMF